MDQKDEQLISDLLEKHRDHLEKVLIRLENAVKLLTGDPDNHKHIYLRVQLDNDGIEFLNVIRTNGESSASVMEYSEPHIEQCANLYMECQIELFLMLLQDDLTLEDAIIRTKFTIYPTLKCLITPGQLVRALQGKTTEEDKDLEEPLKCLRCGNPMYLVGCEHRVREHDHSIYIDLWSCNNCNYLEYRKGTKKPSRII